MKELEVQGKCRASIFVEYFCNDKRKLSRGSFILRAMENRSCFFSVQAQIETLLKFHLHAAAVDLCVYVRDSMWLKLGKDAVATGDDPIQSAHCDVLMFTWCDTMGDIKKKIVFFLRQTDKHLRFVFISN